MKTNSGIVLILMTALCLGAAASPLTVISEYNILVFDSMTSTNTGIGGTVAVGGNAAFVNVVIANGNGADTGVAPPSGPDAVNLQSVGDLSWGSGQLVLGSGIYGGTGTITNVTAPDGTITQGTAPADFFSLESSAVSVSAEYAGLATNGTTSSAFGNVTLEGTDAVLNVFSIDPLTLDTANNIAIVVPDGAAVLINITGLAASFQNAGLTLNGESFNFATNADAWSEVLWNFNGSGTLALGGTIFAGSVLAPNGTLTMTNARVSGQIVAQNLITGNLQTSEIVDNFAFAGTEIPEPGTFAMVGLGSLLFLLGRARGERSRRVRRQ